LFLRCFSSVFLVGFISQNECSSHATASALSLAYERLLIIVPILLYFSFDIHCLWCRINNFRHCPFYFLYSLRILVISTFTLVYVFMSTFWSRHSQYCWNFSSWLLYLSLVRYSHSPITLLIRCSVHLFFEKLFAMLARWYGKLKVFSGNLFIVVSYLDGMENLRCFPVTYLL
jgi:hypothetical protein